MNTKTRMILLISFLVSSGLAFSQYNTNLLDTTKRWSTINNYSAGGFPAYSFFNKFSGDTLIEGVNYKKILTSYEEFMTDWELTGFIREDNGKVFTRTLTGDEGLIYDFAAQEGDTIHQVNYFIIYPIVVEQDVIVDTIDSVYIEPAGEYRKSIQVHLIDWSSFYNELWIERVGSECGILFSGFKISNIVGVGYSLLCYYEDQEMLYKNPEYSLCFYPLDVVKPNPASKTYFHVYPNPSSGDVFLEANNPGNVIYELTICNSTGELVLQTQFRNSEKFRITQGNELPGIYFYTIRSNGKIIQQDKFIIL